MTRRNAAVVGAALFAVAAAVYITWPQARVMSSMAAAHHDVEFSVWRLQWIAHALATAPSRLFEPQIFYPAPHALAYSDATLLQGVIAAPLLWSGLPPLLVYNLLLLAGFAGSGLAMFVLVRQLTGSIGGSLVAAAVFTMAPYRIEHFMHLELQWTMFVPLTFWALHRAAESRVPPGVSRTSEVVASGFSRTSMNYALLAGAFIWLQVLSCVYYGVFLGMLLLVFAPLLILVAPPAERRKTAGVVMVAAAVAVVLTLPYALPYVAAARALGVRDAGEISRYSATVASYFSTSSLNVLWGWTSDRYGGPELRLFPGVVAVLLAVLAVFHRPFRTAVVYVAVVAVAIELSFGANGFVYRALADHVPALQGFRSWSRFGIFVMFGIAALSGFGTVAVLSWIPARQRTVTLVLLLALIAIEYRNHAMVLSPGDPQRAPDVYLMLRRAPPGTVMELPVPGLDRLPGWEPYYQAWQAWHWRPLVNGYSGYYPSDYLETLARMLSFPDERSIGRLRGHDVRFIVIHRAFYDASRYTDLMLRMAQHPELKPWGTFKDSVGLADIFELSPVE